MMNELRMEMEVGDESPSFSFFFSSLVAVVSVASTMVLLGEIMRFFFGDVYGEAPPIMVRRFSGLPLFVLFGESTPYAD